MAYIRNWVRPATEYSKNIDGINFSKMCKKVICRVIESITLRE